jgi:hypothetical protein
VKTYTVSFSVVVDADNEEEAVSEAKQLVIREDFQPDYVSASVEEVQLPESISDDGSIAQ